LETSGTNPTALEKVLPYVDKLIFDIVPLSSEEKFENITKSKTFFVSTSSIVKEIRKSLQLLKKFDKDLFFTTTIVPNLLYRKEDLLEIADTIKDFDANWFIQKYSTAFNAPHNKRFLDIEEPAEMFMEALKEVVLKKHPHLRAEVTNNFLFPYHDSFRIEIS